MDIDLQAIFPKLIQLMLDTVFVVDRDNQILFVSDACETLLGYRSDEMVGTLITQYMHPDDLATTQDAIRRILSGQSHLDFRNRFLRKDGSVVHLLWSARWYEEEQVRVGVARDVSALAQAEAELRFLAHHDPLTQLTNRSLFYDRLDSAIRMAHRRETRVALLFVDINDFKEVNDAYGHMAGDRVLCTIARRLESCIRETDTVARMGGDEFIVLLTDIPAAGSESEHVVAERVDRIRDVLNQPAEAELGNVTLPSCSIGVAHYPTDGEDVDTLLRHADDAMYCAKQHR